MGEKLVVINERCPQNHPCPAVTVCPVKALTQKWFRAPKVDYSKCIVCGRCTYVCPMGALQNIDE